MTGFRIQIAFLSFAYVAVAFVGAGCGHDPNGPGSYQAVMKATQSAQEGLIAKGATLEQKQYPVVGSAWAVDLSGKDVDAETFASLAKLDRIVELNLSNTNIDDDLLDEFETSTVGSVLNDLNLSKNSNLTDAGFEHLSGLLYLTKLDVGGTKITQGAIDKWQKNRAANPRIHASFKKVTVKRD